MRRVHMVGMERGENLSERRHMEKLSTMKKRMVVAMGWLLMALLLLPVGAMAQTIQDVTITVTTGSTPVKDATVTIVDANGEKHEGTAGPNGEAVVNGVPVPTEGTVTVEKGATVVTAALTVNARGKVSPTGIDLTKFKPVEVTVVDAVTGNGIEGAKVTIGTQNAETKSQGKAMLNLMGGRKLPVSVKANGYAESTVMRSIKRFSTPKPLLDAIKLTPVKDVTITVEKNGSGVSDATVTIVDANGKEYKTQQPTGSDGKAVVQNVLVPIEENGTVTVEVGGKKVTAPVKVDKDGKAEPDNIDISQAKAVEVTVVDAKDESVIPGATVAVDAQEATADTDGKVTLKLLGGTTTDPVRYRMVVKKDGYADSTVMRKVDNNGIADPSTIKLTPVRDVTIKVMKRSSPVSGATVKIVDENGNSHTVKTVGDGSASLKQVPVSDKGTVTVEAGGQEVSVPVTVNRDGTAEPSTIDLQKIRSVTITVVDEWGVLIPNGTVTMRAKEAQIREGKVTLSLLGGAGIQYQIVAKGPVIYDVSTVVVSVNADGIADPNTIKLKQKERVTITVVNDDQPEDGATVTIVDAKGNKYKVQTGSHGEADVPKMAGPTEWTVTVEKGGRVVTVPVKVAEDGKLEPDRIDIAKPKGVEVTVVDAVTGKGIEGATVTVGAQTVTADGNGKVVLNLREGGRFQYQVVTTADGYAKSTERRRVREYNGSTRTLTLGRIELVSLAGVTIKVTDNGAEVPDATVTIVDAKGKEYKGTTGSGGKVMFGDVPVLTEGTVTVKSGSTVVTAPVKVKGDGKAEPDNIDISQAKAVVVTVVDWGNREWGLSGAKVTVGAQEGDADYHGTVTLNLLGGTGVKYRMKAEAPTTYSDRTVAVSVNDNGIADPDTIELKYQLNVTITVVNGSSPFEGATVTIVEGDGTQHEETSDSKGKASFKDMPVPTEGTVTVRATIGNKDTVVTVPVAIEGWNGVATPGTIYIGEDNPVGVNKIKTGEVEVTVVEAGSKDAIKGATVTVGNQTVTTDGDGKVLLNLQIDKEGYPVSAEAEGYEANTVKVSVDIRKAKRIQIRSCCRCCGRWSSTRPVGGSRTVAGGGL